MRARLSLADAGLTEGRWREEWEAGRLFLTADGEVAKPWGNETIRVNPDEGWLELKLPAPLAGLANRPSGRYRLACPAEFSYRAGEVAAQAASGAVRYDISTDPETGRWYCDASWKKASAPEATLEELQAGTVVAVDVNAGHLDAAVIAADGNVLGTPFTVPLDLAGLAAPTRDGRLRAAVTALITAAKEHGAQAVVIENLDFEQARAEGRERTGSRPSRGRRGRGYRKMFAGIPTARFRDRLTQMASNAGLSVVVIDPAYSSRWAAVHWLPLLREQHPKTTGHHAAAIVIGRRGLGHRARTRVNRNRTAPEDAARPAWTRTRKPPETRPSPRKPDAPRGQRQPPGGKTGTPHGIAAGNQAAQDRSGPPTGQYSLLRGG
jgi:IS605 OrfB family transposase